MASKTFAGLPDFSDPIGDDFGPASAETAAEARRGVLVRMSPDARRALRRLTLDEDTTVQSLMIEAIDALFVKKGLPPIARS